MVRARWMLLVAFLVVLAACSKNAGTTPTPGTASGSPAPTATVGTSASPTLSSEPSDRPTTPRCRTSDLAGSIVRTSGAAGTTYDTVALKNSSSVPCELTGFPGVSLVDASGTQIGQPAMRNSGSTPSSVTINGGSSGYFQVGFPNPGNFSPGKCSSDESKNLRVYPPGDTQSLLIATAQKYCPGFSVSAISSTQS